MGDLCAVFGAEDKYKKRQKVSSLLFTILTVIKFRITSFSPKSFSYFFSLGARHRGKV